MIHINTSISGDCLLDLDHDKSYAQLNFNFFDEEPKMKFEIEIVKKSLVKTYVLMIFNNFYEYELSFKIFIHILRKTFFFPQILL